MDANNTRLIAPPDGKVHAFRGRYHTVTAPHLIFSTFSYESLPNHVSLDTYHCEERGQQTLYTDGTVFLSMPDRDGMNAANCEPSVREPIAHRVTLRCRMQGGV